MRAVQVTRHGGPDVLRVVEIAPPHPGKGQLVARPAAIGVNFADVYARTGANRAESIPFIIGAEGAGTVSAVGAGVDSIRVGDRVAWKSASGGYAEDVLVDAREAVPVPDAVSLEAAAAILLQGMTAHYLTTSTYPIRKGDTALVHAAAGGVGLLLTQMVKLRDGVVIATASTDEKASRAIQLGASEVIRYDQEEIPAVVHRLTDGLGANVVYDGVGRNTFEASLLSVRTRGLVVLYGMSSGAVPPFDLQRLRPGSVFVTRPTIVDHTRTRTELLQRATEVFDWLIAGRIHVHIGGRYPLEAAATAHADLEGRRTSGKLLLIPG
jgi:NADPH2:quinone reductase